MTHTPVWRTDTNDAGTQAASLQSESLTTRVDLRRPQMGLHDWLLHGRPAPAAINLLGVQLLPEAREQPLIEHYARGGDLVATYAQTPARSVRVQNYWRAIAGPVESGNKAELTPELTIELQVSVQTSLLDSQPALSTISLLAESPVWRLSAADHGTTAAFEELALPATCTRDSGPGCWLFRPADCDWSYAEMVHPLDFSQSLLSRMQGTLTATHLLFASELTQFGLEKGVILRARVRGVFVPRDRDETLVRAAWRAFVQSEPPLTT